MLSFFKKKNSKDLHYDSKLIKQFQKEHEKLVDNILTILENFEEKKEKKVRKLLTKLKSDLLNHFMEEDIKLYRYLNKYYANSTETLHIIKNFESSIKTIQKSIINFLDTYTEENIALDDNFTKEFNAIIDALKERIETEEHSLYTLYIK